LPDGEDPDSYVRAHGKAAFETLLSGAEPLSRFLIDTLRSNVDIGAPEGRAALMQQAKPLVKQIAAPMLSLLIRKEIAQLVGVLPQELDAQFEIRSSSFAAPPKRPEPARPSILRNMLDLVVCDPSLGLLVDRTELAGGVTAGVPELDQADWKLMDVLLQTIAAGQAGPGLGEFFRGTPHESAMQQAEARALKVLATLPTPEEREAEFRDAWERVMERIRKFRAARPRQPAVNAGL